MQYLYDDYSETQNKTLDNDLLNNVRKLDATRYAQSYSAVAEHTWFGWYSDTWKKFLEPTRLSLITEFGAQALPDEETLKTIISLQDLWPSTGKQWRIWEYHNFQKKKNFENTKIDKGKNIEEFMENSQRYQAQLVQIAAEAYRRQKYVPVGGIFQFMFVEPWASMSWGVVDYRRNPKPGFAALARAYQPLLASLTLHEFEYHKGTQLAMPVTVINDTSQDILSAHIAVDLRCGPLVVAKSVYSATIPHDSVVAIKPFDVIFSALGACQLGTQIDLDGDTLSVNHYDVNVLHE